MDIEIHLILKSETLCGGSHIRQKQIVVVSTETKTIAEDTYQKNLQVILLQASN